MLLTRRPESYDTTLRTPPNLPPSPPNHNTLTGPAASFSAADHGQRSRRLRSTPTRPRPGALRRRIGRWTSTPSTRARSQRSVRDCRARGAGMSCATWRGRPFVCCRTRAACLVPLTTISLPAPFVAPRTLGPLPWSRRSLPRAVPDDPPQRARHGRPRRRAREHQRLDLGSVWVRVPGPVSGAPVAGCGV